MKSKLQSIYNIAFHTNLPSPNTFFDLADLKNLEIRFNSNMDYFDKREIDVGLRELLTPTQPHATNTQINVELMLTYAQLVVKHFQQEVEPTKGEYYV